MGVDITTFFGKMKKAKLADFHRRYQKRDVLGASDVPEASTQSLMEINGIDPRDFYIEENEYSHHIERDWILYSFLYYGYTMEPIISNQEHMEIRKKRSAEFCDVFLKAHESANYRENPFWPFFTHGNDKAIIFVVLELTSFNYDKVAIVSNPDNNNLLRSPHTEGKTYREVLPASFFQTLEKAVEQEWDFLVFTFSG